MKVSHLITGMGVLVGTLLVVKATPATAASLYADRVIQPGNSDGLITEGSRYDPDNALGAPDGNFYSLPVQGEAIFSFGSLFTGEGTIFEITWGKKKSQKDWDESVEISAGMDLDNWTLLDTIYNINDGAFTALGAKFGQDSGPYKYLKVVDTSVNQKKDGFDIDAIAVKSAPESVPEPGTVTALIGGAILFLIKRRS